MRKISKIILTNKEGKFLFQLRDEGEGVLAPGKWGLIGGEIEEGETSLMGLQRELGEEIPGCSAYNIRFFKKIFYPPRDANLFVYTGKINDDVEYINKRLTEGQRVEFKEYSSICEMDLAPAEKIIFSKDIFNLE